MAESFFEEKQGPAVLKHAVLSRYVRGYFSKTASASPGRRGFYLDAYAGPGTYGDEGIGSPSAALDALEPLEQIRDVECVFVERDPHTFDALKRLCDRPTFAHATALKGRVEQYIDDLLQQAAGVPLLGFFDPFGMGLPLETLHHVLRRSRSHGRPVPTELLINVSRPGLYRNAGKLRSQASTDATRRAHARTTQRLSGHLGGPWWQDIWLSGTADRIDRIVSGYLERLALPGWYAYNVPVSKEWQGQPVYHLVLLTRHSDGKWLFNECVSSALEEFHDWCHRKQLSLESTEMRAAAWQEEIVKNARRLLTEDGAFVVVERLDDLLGGALGYAREKHIRASLGELHHAGVIADPPKGNLARFEVRPCSERQLW